jgi:L-histidine Nalpha-methyltransferase
VPNDTEFVPQQDGGPHDAGHQDDRQQDGRRRDDRHDGGEDIVEIALTGLTAAQKTLPAMLFYDDEGCRLFYEITRLPEYYLTRTEVGLLHSIAPAIVPDGFRDGVLVEFGGSDESKARILLDRPDTPFSTYVSIDVAAPALRAMQDRLRRSHPALNVVPIVADFMQPLRLPPLGASRMGFFPGSTIGNLDPAAATAFLESARSSLGADSWFLLGADLRKSPRLLLQAYNDAAGVTAAFNLNLLGRLNREAGADFDLTRFRHAAVWNDRESRIEMHLISTRDQTVRLGGHSILFREGESIHTENSYKHTPEKLIEIADKAGWEMRKVWKDHDGLFGIVLFRAG